MHPREASPVEVELSQNYGESRSKLETLISDAAVELGQNWNFSELNYVFTKNVPFLEQNSQGSFFAKRLSEDLEWWNPSFDRLLT